MLRRLRISALLVAAFAAVFGSVTWAPAQDGHTKPIELVIPYGPGGSHHLTTRAVAAVAHQHLGQPPLVVLKPGGDAVGSQQVIRGRPLHIGHASEAADPAGSGRSGTGWDGP